MNVHTYEKLWLASAMVLIVLLIGSITYGTLGAGVAMINADENTIDPDALDKDERFADPRVEQIDENTYEVYVVAGQFFFNPGSFEPIEVPANSEVTFYITSQDVIHSFSIPGTNANTMVIPGEVASLTVEVTEPASYGIICTEYCGPNHHDMEGEFIVVPQDEFSTEGDG